MSIALTGKKPLVHRTFKFRGQHGAASGKENEMGTLRLPIKNKKGWLLELPRRLRKYDYCFYCGKKTGDGSYICDLCWEKMPEEQEIELGG